MFNKDRWNEILEALTANKFRTLLTAFGVFWGISILVLLLALTNGLKNGATLEFNKFAINSINTWTQGTSIAYKGLPRRRRFRYKLGDIAALKSQFPEIKYASKFTNKPKSVTPVTTPSISEPTLSFKYEQIKTCST